MLWHVLFYCAGNSLLSCDLTQMVWIVFMVRTLGLKGRVL